MNNYPFLHLAHSFYRSEAFKCLGLAVPSSLELEYRPEGYCSVVGLRYVCLTSQTSPAKGTKKKESNPSGKCCFLHFALKPQLMRVCVCVCK